jgi:hypothetical protein
MILRSPLFTLRLLKAVVIQRLVLGGCFFKLF